MEQTSEQIRAAVERLQRPASNTPYPRQLRARVTAHVRRQRGEGATWDRVAAEVGISVYTLRDWLEKDAGPGRVRRLSDGEGACAGERAEALLPVRVKVEEAAAPEAGTLELTTPKGYHLSGLSITQALELLRRLS